MIGWFRQIVLALNYEEITIAIVWIKAADRELVEGTASNQSWR